MKHKCEVNTTDNRNLNNQKKTGRQESLNETKTFKVASSSAEGLREKINASNERIEAREGVRPVNPNGAEHHEVINRQKAPQLPVRSEANHSSVANKSALASRNLAPAAVNAQQNYNYLKTQKQKEKRESSGEGGNTVISVLKAIVYIVFVIVVAVVIALGVINIGNDVFAFVKSDEIVEVVVPEYATLDDVADVLYKNDIIKYPKIFKIFAVAKNYDGEFLAGTYSVSGMMNYETLLNEFKEKITYATVNITIPEGYTTDEIISLFVDGYGIGTREGFIDVIQNYDFDYWFIRELEEGGRTADRIYRLDGYLFPDTYQFYTTSSEVTVINKLLKRFSQIFTKEYREQCATLGYTVDEVITLASMIEKEAGSPSEFFRVSSVFHNRLNNKWTFPKLESDATVLYVLRHEAGERVTLSASDLDYDTPYNTYIYEGLPPGPIANPSASAMLASLMPESTGYYYFVANKGVTYYSSTKAEHDAYIAQFKSEADSSEQQTVGDVPTGQ